MSKKAKHRLLTCRHPGTHRVMLPPSCKVGNSVASRMQRVGVSVSKAPYRNFCIKIQAVKTG